MLARTRATPGGGWRSADLARLVTTWTSGTLVLAAAGAVLPGLSATHWWSWPLAAAATGVAGGLARPVLAWTGARVGWLALLLLGLVGQALVIHLGLAFVPGITADSFATLLGASWVTAALGTLVGWVTTTGTPESLVHSLVRSGRRRDLRVDDDLTGVLFVQLDGVPAPMMRWALQAGLMPTVRRWVDAPTHRLVEWTVQLPCTTPASQLGILHGTCDGVPAFRWFDRELGRVLVANRPADARIVEDRVADGHGLLADDGVSVSNLFSGDASRSPLVFSRVELTRGRFETRRSFAWFLLRPDGMARALNRAVVQVVRERFQSRRQRRRDVVPRVARPWQFAGLRAGTNALLREVNLAVVAAELMSGRRSVYVDFVDYDEVSHHAGPMRLDALEVLTDLDQVVAVLEQVTRAAPRPYEIVLLSDHGQSSGAPFEQRYGEDLAATCRRLMHTSVAWEGAAVEGWGRVAGLAGGVAGTDTVPERAAASVARRLDHRTAPAADPAPSDPVVLGSGNLGLVYAGGALRLTLDDLTDRWPELVPGLAAHPGVSFVAGVDADGRGHAVGARGRRNLATGAVTGLDPLAALPPHAARVLADALRMPAAPDLYVNSVVDPGTDEVAAFEDLVGSHGGLGGWQDLGLLLAPSALVGDWAEQPIEGATSLHRVLVGMLEQLGHRRDLADRTAVAS